MQAQLRNLEITRREQVLAMFSVVVGVNEFLWPVISHASV